MSGKRLIGARATEAAEAEVAAGGWIHQVRRPGKGRPYSEADGVVMVASAAL